MEASHWWPPLKLQMQENENQIDMTAVLQSHFHFKMITHWTLNVQPKQQSNWKAINKWYWSCKQRRRRAANVAYKRGGCAYSKGSTHVHAARELWNKTGGKPVDIPSSEPYCSNTSERAFLMSTMPCAGTAMFVRPRPYPPVWLICKCNTGFKYQIVHLASATQ